MDHFHVFVRQDANTMLRVFAVDLTEDEVKHRIVGPYRRGKSLVQSGTIIPVASLRELRICRNRIAFESAYMAEHAAHSEAIEALNQGDGMYFLRAGPSHDDMAESFENVTNQFLQGKEPGDGGWLSALASIANHTLVSTVLGDIVPCSAGVLPRVEVMAETADAGRLLRSPL